MNEDDNYIGVAKYASQIGKSRQWVYYLINTGRLKSRKITKKVVRIQVLPPVDKLLDISKVKE